MVTGGVACWIDLWEFEVGSGPRAAYGVKDAACPISTRGGTRLVRLVRGGDPRLRRSGRVRAIRRLKRCRADAHTGDTSTPPSGLPLLARLVRGGGRGVSD